MADTPLTVEDFSNLLAGRDEDYILLGELQPGHAHIRFTGKYAGKTVIWDAWLNALPHDGMADTVRSQYLDIGAAHGDLVGIRIGLAVRHIDIPTLRKTVIMIRNYRRLRPGRHSFSG